MKAILSSQGTLVKLKIPVAAGGKKAGGGRRGKITQFSRASRKRLLELFATLAPKKFIFITLTYGQKFPSVQVSKKHLKNFIQRLKNRFPKLAGVWRLEFQERGAPHFHLLMTHLPFIDFEKIEDMWEEIIGYEYINHTIHNCNKCEKRCEKYGTRNKTFTRIEMCKSKKKVMSYVSKYIAKKSVAPAKRASGFNYVAYQHAVGFSCADNAADHMPIYGCDTQETHEMRLAIIARHEATNQEHVETVETGRWWGVIGKENMPYAHQTVIEWEGKSNVLGAFRQAVLDHVVKIKDEWRYQFRKHINTLRFFQGLTLFTDEAHEWLTYWVRLSADLVDSYDVCEEPYARPYPAMS